LEGNALRADVVGTEDGLGEVSVHPREPPHPRRVHGRRAHVSTEFRMKETGAKREEVKAAEFKDSVGIGSYRIDLHPSYGRGQTPIDISSLALPDPAGGVAAERVENLLPGLQESRGDAHHQRLLPAASGRMEHRRSRGRAGRVLCDEETHAPRGAQTERAAEELSSSPHGPGGAARVAEGDAEVELKPTRKYAVVLLTAPD